MRRALLAWLGLAAVGGAAAEPAASSGYHAYWLSIEPRSEYEVLLLSRRPITALLDAASPADEAVVITTYARDSIWNTDRRPVKPLPPVKKLAAERIELGGQAYRWAPARLEDAIRLLETPEGTMPIHRLNGAADGQEELIRSLAARLRRQRN